MPPKQGRRKRKNAHAINEEEQLARVEHTHGEVMPIRTGENDADEPPAVRARVETVTQPKWTLNSRVREVLLHDVNILETLKLNDFLRNNVGGRGVVDSNENVTMEAFAIKPDMYIQGEELRILITALPAYKKVQENIKVRNTFLDVACNLEKGVYSLRQWDEFTGKESILLMARVKLNAALKVAKRQANVSHGAISVLVKGVYESVYNAEWHYVEGVGGEGFGMKVKEGHPPRPWEEDEVMKGSAEDDNDNDNENEKPEGGRPELMVLTSEEGWPYTKFSMDKSCDIYVNKEVVRTWYTILKGLDEYFADNVHANKELTPYVLMGTPGIGKSFAAGSFLLYQLLHYNAKRLQVVAYFTHGEAYLFEKNSDGGKVTWYKKEETAVSVVHSFSDHKRGYIIYDVAGKSTGPPPTRLPPPGWGMIAISSHDRDVSKRWDKQKGALPIVMNCPTLNNIKAMCAWEKRNQADELESYWNSIKERINNIGPLPRYIFNDVLYLERRCTVETALSEISEYNLWVYKDILRGNSAWKDENFSHKLVKIYRLADENFDSYWCSAINDALYKETFGEVMRFFHSPILKALFTKKGVLIAEKFEEYGINAFRDRNFVSALGEELKIIQPPGRRVGQQSILQRRDLLKYASDGTLSFPTGMNGKKMRIEYNMLYHPSVPDFPLVDGFYFVKSAERRVTLIGIQTKTARDHETTVTAVSKLKEYLETCFSDWTAVSKKVSWEIIYLQPYEADEKKQIRTWQECNPSTSKKYTPKKHEAIINFWNERVNQYQVNMSQPMIMWLMEALEAICKQRTISTIEGLIRIRRQEVQEEVNFN